MDNNQIFIYIEDYLGPRLKLDLGEVRLYYHLLRHTRLIDKHDALLSVAKIAEYLNCSKNAVKPRLRTLEKKGIIEVVNTGWAGTRIKVYLPDEIIDIIPEQLETLAPDIEDIDFYKDQRYRASILEREHWRCFYCRRVLTDEDSGLDHADPQRSGGSNSYRNVVAACHTCNSSKGDDSADEFIRKLYKRGFLNAEELEMRMADLKKLKEGLLRPIV